MFKPDSKSAIAAEDLKIVVAKIQERFPDPDEARKRVAYMLTGAQKILNAAGDTTYLLRTDIEKLVNEILDMKSDAPPSGVDSAILDLKKLTGFEPERCYIHDRSFAGYGGPYTPIFNLPGPIDDVDEDIDDIDQASMYPKIINTQQLLSAKHMMRYDERNPSAMEEAAEAITALRGCI